MSYKRTVVIGIPSLQIPMHTNGKRFRQLDILKTQNEHIKIRSEQKQFAKPKLQFEDLGFPSPEL
eukprot:2246890-Amphidinium_carterae.1